jgi:hypothetical protein
MYGPPPTVFSMAALIALGSAASAWMASAPFAPVDTAVLRDPRYWIRNAEIVEREKAC